jgi:hypothetical protein
MKTTVDCDLLGHPGDPLTPRAPGDERAHELPSRTCPGLPTSNPATNACTGPAGRSAMSARWPVKCLPNDSGTILRAHHRLWRARHERSCWGEEVAGGSGTSIAVSKLLAWVDLQSERSQDVRYEMSRVAAAVLLERLASGR